MNNKIIIEGKEYDLGEVTGIDLGYDKDKTYITSANIVRGVYEIEFSCQITHRCKFCGFLFSFEDKENIKCINGCEGIMTPISSYNASYTNKEEKE